MRQIKLGFVGCGGAMRVMFGPILPYLDIAEMTAIVDPDREKAESVSRDFGPCQVYTDLQQMLAKTDIDAAVICSPVFAHQSDVVKAARAGKHVFVEKPMARTVAECDRMIRACEEDGVKLMVGFMKRFNPCFQLATRMIEEGQLGEIFKVDSQWDFYSSHHPDNWRHKVNTLGGVYQDHASHTIDLAIWWLGDVAGVCGHFDIVQERTEVEDLGLGMLTHAGGGISIHQHISVSHKRDMEMYRIYGTEATLEIWYAGGSWSSNQPFTMRRFEKGHIEKDINLFNLDPAIAEPANRIRGYNPYYRELEHFCRCIIEDEQPIRTGIDGRKVMEVINATYISSAADRKITLPLRGEFDLESVFRNKKGQRTNP